LIGLLVNWFGQTSPILEASNGGLSDQLTNKPINQLTIPQKFTTFTARFQERGNIIVN
jgi:hypothetical protein